jgi:hypothetical protein
MFAFAGDFVPQYMGTQIMRYQHSPRRPGHTAFQQTNIEVPFYLFDSYFILFFGILRKLTANGVE